MVGLVAPELTEGFGTWGEQHRLTSPRGSEGGRLNICCYFKKYYLQRGGLMVQIGNFHIGKAEAVSEPKLNNGEAFCLWNFLAARYECMEKTQIYLSLIHDPDFKLFAGRELNNILRTQVEEAEKLLEKYVLPLPARPPKSAAPDGTNAVITDRLIFRDIFTGCENFLYHLVHTICTFITNDSLRKAFIQFLTKELEVYDDLCKYGKVKGWLQPPPLH